MNPALADGLRVVARHRVLLSAALTAAAVATALPLVAPDPPATLQVVTAAHDLLAGAPLTADDLVARDVPVEAAPEGVLTDPALVVGRATAGPVRRGEALTDVRLLGAGLVRGRGLVAAPVRLADGATAALLRAGDRVDVLAAATDGSGRVAATVASALEVLAVPTGGSDPDGALVVLAATPATAAVLAAAAVRSRLSVTVLGR